MKRGFFILAFFFFLFSLFAQNRSLQLTESTGATSGKSNFKGGLRGGFTGSLVTGDNFGFEGFNKFGGYVGAFVNFPVSKSGKWLIQPELNFIMKGCKHSLKTDDDGIPIGKGVEYKIQLMYLEIPVLAKWRFFKGLEVEAGPSFGFLLKNTDVEKVNGYLNVGAPPFARFELSGILGIGYLFFNHLGVSLRYQGSLMPIRKPKASDWLYLDRGQYNQTFAFSVYYQF